MKAYVAGRSLFQPPTEEFQFCFVVIHNYNLYLYYKNKYYNDSKYYIVHETDEFKRLFPEFCE